MVDNPHGGPHLLPFVAVYPGAFRPRPRRTTSWHWFAAFDPARFMRPQFLPLAPAWPPDFTPRSSRAYDFTPGPRLA